MRPAICLVAPLLAAWVGSPALALTCGTRNVNEGQNIYQVEQMCGPPSWRDSRVDYVTQLIGYGSQGPIYQQVQVNIDVWVYNFGSTRLMQKLTFANGRLNRIDSLGYGD